jgi:hypothetical protein
LAAVGKVGQWAGVNGERRGGAETIAV